MKIALIHDSTTYWLAGETGVDERVHSSAADLVFGGAISFQEQTRVRAIAKKWRERGNYSSEVSFTTTRKFATLAAAEEFAATYDLVYPRTGNLECYGASGSVVATMGDALVTPPRRVVTGVSVRIDYTVVGGHWYLPT